MPDLRGEAHAARATAGRARREASAGPFAPAHEAFRGARFFSSLDGLRCIAIVAVVYHHANEGRTRWLLETRGFLGVDLFFVISGFLIVTLLLRERDRRGSFSLRNFYARRALRIMPLYYGVLTLCLVVFTLVLTRGKMAGPILHDLPYCFSYTSNWVALASFLSITWSLSAEEQFYLLWPPIEKYLARPLLALVVLIVLSQTIQLGLIDAWLLTVFGFGHDQPTMLRESTFTPILLGVLAAHVLHERRGYDWAARLLGFRAAPLCLLAAVLLALGFLPEDLRGTPRLFVHLLFLLLITSAVVREDHVLASAFDLAPVRRIGVVSYGIYLFHMFVLHGGAALVRRGMPASLLFPVVLLASWGVAELSYRSFEARFLRLGNRFRA